jgi:hypothetical protein
VQVEQDLVHAGSPLAPNTLARLIVGAGIVFAQVFSSGAVLVPANAAFFIHYLRVIAVPGLRACR